MVAAMRAGGKSVAVIDLRPFGGTCALRGCDPKKLMIGVASAFDHARRMPGKGVAGALRLDWPGLLDFESSFTDPCHESARIVMTARHCHLSRGCPLHRSKHDRGGGRPPTGRARADRSGRGTCPAEHSRSTLSPAAQAAGLPGERARFRFRRRRVQQVGEGVTLETLMASFGLERDAALLLHRRARAPAQRGRRAGCQGCRLQGRAGLLRRTWPLCRTSGPAHPLSALQLVLLFADGGTLCVSGSAAVAVSK